MSAVNLNQLWARAIVEELARSGLQDAVICPGSRSSPLALAFAEATSIRTWSIVDERSAAFFALGIAKASGRAAAVVATSGSAGGHFLPAAMEATQAHVPLVLLTADRPLELQDWGAPQTLPQRGLLGDFARLSLDLGMPEALDARLLHLRASVDRAFATAHGAPRGVVHLNVPFREPLAPTPHPFDRAGLSDLAERGRESAPLVALFDTSPHVDAGALAEVKARLRNVERGLIVCGPRDADDGFGEAIRQLSAATGYPVIAEATSQARFGFPRHLSHADALLRNAAFAAAHHPELILRFGGGLTPKVPQQWMDCSGAEIIVISDGGALIDPGHRASRILVGDSVHAARTLAVETLRAPGPWGEAFTAADRRIQKRLEQLSADAASLVEPTIAREVVAALPEHAILFVSSSMPIRDVDAFSSGARTPLRVLASRGANGIDGITSTSLGVAAASGRPVVLLTGDLALLHDLHGLLLARRHQLPLVVVVVNNDGGGIFSFLPVAGTTPHFEPLFGTPHGLDFAPLAQFVGATMHRPEDAPSLRRAIKTGVEARGLHLIEVKTEREENVRLHRSWFEQLSLAAGNERT